MRPIFITRKRPMPFVPVTLSAVIALLVGPALALFFAPQAALAQRRAYIADNGGTGRDDGARANTAHKPPPLLQVPPYFITYWGHDSSGYHPCIIVALEGDGSTDMAGMPVQLQAQFRVLAEGLLTVARCQTVFSTVPGQKQLITEPMVGKRSFELEQNPNDWPVIECKILAKVNDANDDEVQSLFPTPPRVHMEAMTDDEARSRLSFLLGFPRPKKPKPNLANNAQPPSQSQSYGTSPKPPVDEKPLVAVAATLGSPIPKPVTRVQEGFEQYLQKSSLPGLGDDFYQFEKAFGGPASQVDNGDRDWVWVVFHKHPQVAIYAGSKGGNGKADVVLAAIDTDIVLNDTQFANIARDLSSKFKSEKMAPAEHSVRYGQGGRVELTNIAAQSYRAVYFTTRDADQNQLAIVAVSRQPGSLSELLKEEGRKAGLLKFLLKGLGANAN